MPTDVLVDLTPLDSGSRYRGIGRYVSALATALTALSDEDRCGLTFAGLTGLRRGDIDPTLTYTGDPSFRQRPFGQRNYEWRRRLRLGGAARRSGARLLHHTDPSGTPLFGRMPRVITAYDLIPLVMHQEYLRPTPGARERRVRRDTRRYASARRIVAISAATKNDLVEHLGIDPDTIDVTHLGVDHARYHTTPSDGEAELVRSTLGVDGPFVLYLGAWDARKNIGHLVHAFARSGVGDDVRLVIAGKIDRRGKAVISRAADEAGLTAGSGNEVVVAGYVSEELVPACYRQCLVHVCPSLYEGFGLPVIEAMACGAPTITTARSSLGEVAGDAAVLVDGTDVEESAAELARVVGDAALRDDLARRGATRARTFKWESCARATVATYVRALAD